jgi:hypothetical protein
MAEKATEVLTTAATFVECNHWSFVIQRQLPTGFYELCYVLRFSILPGPIPRFDDIIAPYLITQPAANALLLKWIQVTLKANHTVPSVCTVDMAGHKFFLQKNFTPEVRKRLCSTALAVAQPSAEPPAKKHKTEAIIHDGDVVMEAADANKRKHTAPASTATTTELVLSRS